MCINVALILCFQHHRLNPAELRPQGGSSTTGNRKYFEPIGFKVGYQKHSDIQIRQFCLKLITVGSEEAVWREDRTSSSKPEPVWLPIEI